MAIDELLAKLCVKHGYHVKDKSKFFLVEQAEFNAAVNELMKFKELTARLMSERDNWRKQALEEDALVNKMKSAIAELLAATREQEVRNEMCSQAYRRRRNAEEALRGMV